MIAMEFKTWGLLAIILYTTKTQKKEKRMETKTNHRKYFFLLAIVTECTKTNLIIFTVHLILLDHLSACQTAMVDNGIHFCPCGKFPFPVCDGGERSNYEKGSLDSSSKHFGQKCYRLDSLTKTHLICQNAILPNKRCSYRKKKSGTYCCMKIECMEE